jgi:hypothetical protein
MRGYTINYYLREELKEYIATIGELTDDEIKELKAWVAAGNSVNDNPFYIVYEGNRPMDFIAARRIEEDMFNHPEDYIFGFNEVAGEPTEWDTSPMESFWGKLKQEWLNDKRFRTREDAKRAVFWYIEVYYKNYRLHEYNGCKTPNEHSSKTA